MVANNPQGGPPYHAALDHMGGKVSVPWLQWFNKLQKALGSFPWVGLDFSGSNLTDIEIRHHNDLQSFQGGVSGEYYHLSSAEHTLAINSVQGPVGAIGGNVVLFDGITGRLIKDGGTLGSAAFTSSSDYDVAGAAVAAQAASLPLHGTADNASALLGFTWGAPDAIGSGTPNTGEFTTIQVTTAAGYKSSDGSAGYTGTVTTASLVGKTITFKDGIVVSFT